MTHETFTKEQQNHTNQLDYSVDFTLSQIIGQNTQRLKIVSIPPPERRGEAFFRIVDEFGLIVADQLCDWQKAQRYFECGEGVKHG